MSGKSAGTEDPLIRRLRFIARESPDLKDAAALYEAFLPLLRDADLHVAPLSLSREEARKKMERGQPLLYGLDVELDIEAVRELMIKLAAALEAAKGNQPLLHRPGLPRLSLLLHKPSPAARRIRIALEKGTLDPGSLLPSVACGDAGPVTSVSAQLELDPGLLLALVRNALKPALRAWCRQAAPMAEGIPWPQGTCFVCGAPATLAELQDNDQVKHLRCGSCGADWQGRRLQCMSCGNEDHQMLHYLYADSERERLHVEACDRCYGYLKVISSFAPNPAEFIPVEDLATLHLDFIAWERGYMRQDSAGLR